MLDSSTFVP
jgi:hypothetical protein